MTEKNKIHQGNVIDTIDGIDVIECTVCGFKHVNPLPSQEELETLYKKEYYSLDKPQYLKDSEEDQEWWEMTYRQYFHLFDKHLKKEAPSLFEIGSGPGFFLKVGKEHGWDVLGIEPSKQAVAFSKQFDVPVIHDFFHEETAKKLGTFDLIFMDTLLEHVPNPSSMIALCSSLLNPGGLLCVISPNDYNPLQKILRNQKNYPPWWIVPRHHLNYFDFTSIQSLFKQHQLQVVESLGTFPMEFFLLCDDNYIENHALGREVHGKRKTLEKLMLANNPKLLESFYQWLGMQGLGRSFVVIAKKPS
ncbi:putative SAM-dependent methyltransferase [Waddlia chondrophila 2032/99]|nr:class I SAM-dependent methyltransferase [Waddlia chondrophila]CCB91277.1 putative SAM-dependent methyltransferase [Waddlia chondrophila 2032/99]